MTTPVKLPKQKPQHDALMRTLKGVQVGKSVRVKRGDECRTFTLNRETVNEKERTVELSFSSETDQVERWFGIEILDHGPQSVRLDRIRNSGPLLFNHSFNSHIGVTSDVRLEQRRGKALVRFGNSAMAEEKWRDVLDGILVHVSVGYSVFEMVLEERRADGVDVWRITDWEPYEISMVPAPADLSVGVGRAADNIFEIVNEERAMDENEETGTPAAPAAQPIRSAADPLDKKQIQVIENRGAENERQRIADLHTAAARFSSYCNDDLLQRYIKEGKTAEQLRLHIVDQLPDQSRAGSGDLPADLGLGRREVERYSVMRAIRAIMAAKEGNTAAMKEAAFEFECSREIGERLGREARGFFVPMDVMLAASAKRSLEMQRTLNINNGADLIDVDHMDDIFIEALRPNSVALRAGVTVLDGLVGNLAIPRELLTPTFYWIGDDESPTESEGSFGNIRMSPKTIAGAVPMSRLLLKQSSPRVEQLVQNAMLKGSGLAIDLAVFEGSGSENQPLGVVNMTGINAQTVSSAGSPTFAEMVGFETKVAADDALQGSLAYVTTPTVRGNLKTTPKEAGQAIYILEGSEANGYPVLSTSQLTANRIVYGNFADVMVGMWGVLEINPDAAAKAASGGLVLRMFQDADVGVGHAQSFCINA